MVYAYVSEHFLSCKDTCFASNGYFANLFGVKSKAISVAIGKLKRLGYINVNYSKNDKNYQERKTY